MDVKHMKNIMSGLSKEPHLVCNLSPAIGLICKEQCANPDEFTKEKLEEGEYKVETLDGNHSSAALKHLAAEYPNEENFKKRETILYAGLSDEDALYLGYRQNEITKHGKAASTYTLLCLMRRQLISASGTLDCDEISDGKEIRAKWHDSLRRLLNVQVSRKLQYNFQVLQDIYILYILWLIYYINCCMVLEALITIETNVKNSV